jgi:hypothetical protein
MQVPLLGNQKNPVSANFCCQPEELALSLRKIRNFEKMFVKTNIWR